MIDFIPITAVVVFVIYMCVFCRFILVADHREKAIETLRFQAWAHKNNHDVLGYYETFGGFWSMLRKWTFDQFYPGVGE